MLVAMARVGRSWEHCGPSADRGHVARWLRPVTALRINDNEGARSHPRPSV
jgi:hypothetical protein